MILFVFFKLRLMAFQKFARTILTAQLKNIIAHRRFNQYGKVASDRDRQRYRTDVDVEDGFGFGTDTQTVELLHILVVRLDQIDNELQDFFGADGSFAENMADIEYPQAAHFKNRAA